MNASNTTNMRTKHVLLPGIPRSTNLPEVESNTIPRLQAAKWNWGTCPSFNMT